MLKKKKKNVVESRCQSTILGSMDEDRRYGYDTLKCKKIGYSYDREISTIQYIIISPTLYQHSYNSIVKRKNLLLKGKSFFFFDKY